MRDVDGTRPRWDVPPLLIQGGMGVGVSSWGLAREVSRLGHLGVVSGTALDTVLVRRLQDGDAGGHMRRAMAQFPVPSIAEEVLERHFRTEGRPPGAPYRRLPMRTLRHSTAWQDLCVLGAFVEVTLAKWEHRGLVGINLLSKIQLPTAPTLFGAMLAGVDCVLMGAGIPRDIPGVLDALARLESVETTLEVTGCGPGRPAPRLEFDPVRWRGRIPVRRPAFLAIVGSHTLATVLRRKSTGVVDGFVVEGPTAGGHNAPPRGAPVFDAEGQPVYGERDRVDFEVMRSLGVPFWIAGGVTSPDAVRAALDTGAAGVQVGTLFAFCRESGVAPELRRQVLALVREGREHVRTDPRASSTGYPFKVVALPGSVSDRGVYTGRRRTCDLGYLREAYLTDDGRIGYRCAAEPVATYLGKGGRADDTLERRCLCNGLLSTIGLGQVQRDGAVEPPLVTSGDALGAVRALLRLADDYGAADVVRYLLPDGTPTTPRHPLWAPFHTDRAASRS